LCLIETVGIGGGAEQLLANLVPEMRRQGAHVEILALFDWPEDLGSELEKMGVPLHRLSLSGRRSFLKATLKLSKFLRHNHFDFFWGHLYLGNIYARLAQLLSPRSQAVITLHNQGYASDPPTSPRGWLRVFLEWLLLSGAKGKVAVSNVVARDYGAQFGWRSIRVIHNGIDVSRFSAAPSREERVAVRGTWGFTDQDFVLITPARFIPKKGHAVLVNALVRLRHEKGLEVKVIAAGEETPFFAELERLVKDNDLLESVKFSPTLRQAELFPLIAASDGVVLPSLREGFGIAAAEAMALGMPVILTRIDGFMELVGDSDVALGTCQQL